jgi:hypothetical protein
MQRESDPDVSWVAQLSGRGKVETREALDEAERVAGVRSYIERQHAREGRESYIEIDAPLELYALVRLVHPQHVVEVGVSSGVSSAHLLDALERNGQGRLHSIDLPSYERPPNGHNGRPRASWSLPPGRSPGWAVPPRLRKHWDLRLGDKAYVLPLIAEQIPRIDLLLYDVPHRDRVVSGELTALNSLLGPSAVVIIDHGPGGELCSALEGWATREGAKPIGRAGLGLYGARKPVRRIGPKSPNYRAILGFPKLAGSSARIPCRGVRRGSGLGPVSGRNTGRSSAGARAFNEG